MARYSVPFNKHKYVDLSDTPRQGSMVVVADSAEDAGHVAQASRLASDETGVRTAKGNRYFIGLIHYGSIRLVRK